MTDQTLQVVIAAICTAAPPTIAALAAWRSAKRAGVKTDENTAVTVETSKKVDDVAANALAAVASADVAASKVDTIAKTSEQIASHTNGNLSKLTADVTRLMAMNDENQKTIATLTSLLKVRRSDVAERPEKDRRQNGG
jgi:cyanophycinase-like exopeptidase